MIEDIDIRVGDGPRDTHTLRDDEKETDFIEITDVVVHIQFYPDGTAGLWVNINVGNISDEHYVSVEDIEINLKNSKIELSQGEPHPAEAGDGHAREDVDCNYIWNEATSTSDEENDWRSMFDDHELITDETIFEKKGYYNIDPVGDRHFGFSVDSEDTVDHLICNPVTFTNVNASGGRLIDLNTMVSEAQNTLLPTSLIGNYCPLDGCRNQRSESRRDQPIQHRDVASLWAKWDKIDIMMHDRQVNFEFEFLVESEIGDIRHLYIYYVLPPGARFVRSMAQDEVSIFKPREIHWMFKAWEQETNIERTGPENRILRSKLKNANSAYNLAEYVLVGRERANRLLENITITLIPALIGTIASALLTATIFGANVQTETTIYILAALFFLTILVLISGIYIRIYDKYTVFSKAILAVAERVNKFLG
ncbi:hypothetical protein [Haloferax sp. YSMS24]|uniref:hypothetical protein n=1 Tax=Haloferax sp. YSMS24 TaxID=3388425 RepID=UPI00398D02D9